MTPSRIIELASEISAQAKTIEQQLESSGQPPLSFELDASHELPLAAYGAQQALLEAIDELQFLVQGPIQSLMYLSGLTLSARHSIHVIIRFRLAHAVPVGQTASFANIARFADLDLEDTKRVLRYAMTYRIFTEPLPGEVAHTPASHLLAKNEHLVAWAKVALDEILPASTRTPDAMQRWPHSQEPNEAGFNLAHNEAKPMFEVLAQDPARAKLFSDSMKLFFETPQFSLDHTVDSFPWSAISKMVDIGGSMGHASIAIARKNPHIHCVVQDLKRVFDGVEVPPDLRDRVSFMPHDFLTDQPVKDADVYFLRWILHDWSDLYAVRILRALIPALRTGVKVVLHDTCVPEVGTVSLFKQRHFRGMDLTMKHIQNGRERDPTDWKTLFELADGRFELQEIIRPTGAALAFIVAG